MVFTKDTTASIDEVNYMAPKPSSPPPEDTSTTRALMSPRDRQENKSTAQKLSECPTGKYNSFIAELMAAVAGWSYADIGNFRDYIAPKYGMPSADIMEIKIDNDAMLINATAQIIRTADKKTMIVAFRGTEPTNVINFVTDASFKKVETFNGMKVHQGFLTNTEGVWYGAKGVLAHLLRPRMMEKGFNYTAPIAPGDLMDQDKLEAIYITGHSLGGAMAQIAAMALQDENNPLLWNKVRGVYTYGQPMVVDDWQRSECEERVGDVIFRHVFANDLVPHVPPLISGSFDHVGKEYRYNKKSGSWYLRNDGWFPLARGRATQVFSMFMTTPFLAADAVTYCVQWLPGIFSSPWSVLDHSPANYIEACEDRNVD